MLTPDVPSYKCSTPSYKCNTHKIIHSISLEPIFISAMPIDLNILPDQHGELLPDLNEAPAYEQEDAITYLQEHQLYEDGPPVGSSYLISMKNLPMNKKVKSLISRNINLMKMKPIYKKVSPYIFVTMDCLVCMS
jgi:hypothetical protein